MSTPQAKLSRGIQSRSVLATYWKAVLRAAGDVDVHVEKRTFGFRGANLAGRLPWADVGRNGDGGGRDVHGYKELGLDGGVL